MIRLEYLKLKGHPQLGDIELFLSEPSEIKNSAKPYTSVIIGPNGTGKSYLLKTIAEIFRQFHFYHTSEKRSLNLPFEFHLRYKLHHNHYEIVTSDIQIIEKRNMRREYYYFKNRPWEFEFMKDKALFDRHTPYDIPLSEIEFPERLLVNSLMLTDRFVFQNSNHSDFYQYLGVRSTNGSTSTKSSSRRTIKHLFRALSDKTDFVTNLKELLSFLDFDQGFEVNYSTKINKLFFSGALTVNDFKQYFEYWWDENFQYSNRKQDNPLWSIPFYKNNFQNHPDKIEAIVIFLNDLSTSDKLKRKKNSEAKLFSIDLLAAGINVKEIEMIGALESLDILNLQGIMLKKLKSDLSISDLSSGEYHLIVSLISIFANILEDSVILIDEPEISLHPNWQMRYISFLKKVFNQFKSCHFIITTHSHFLISDLEGKSSSVTALDRDDKEFLKTELLEGKNTYGWSAEEVLYRVFKVKTTRNFYLETDLRELLHKIAVKSNEKARMMQLLGNLKSLDLTHDDPLNLVISRAEGYLQND